MSKSKQKKFVMTASLLRIILIVILIICSLGGAFGFSYAVDVLKKHAIEVSHKKVDAIASNGTIQALKTTQQELDNNKDVLEKIGLLRSDSQFPEFRVRDELAAIAAKNNLELEGFSYGGQAAAATGTPSSGTAATPTPAPAAASSGGNTISISVTPKTTNYVAFLQFVYDLEQHLPKMKIQGISVKAGGEGGQSVSVQPVVIDMYIR